MSLRLRLAKRLLGGKTNNLIEEALQSYADQMYDALRNYQQMPDRIDDLADMQWYERKAPEFEGLLQQWI
jgi:hypothetical protein